MASEPRAAVLVAAAALLALPGLPLPHRVAGLRLPTTPEAPGRVAAQQGNQDEQIRRQIRESQSRLDEIRGERQRLRQQLDQLTSQVHTVSEEIRNIERQIGTSSSVVAELDLQINALLEQVSLTTRDMLITHDRLTARKVVLRERLREIYKRGPLGAVQVLLSANSFSDLLNRYKYLHQVALFDRMLVEDVSQLEVELERQRDRLEDELQMVQDLRDEKGAELRDLEQLERQRQRRLRTYSSRRSQARSRLSQLASEEQRLRNLLAELERARRETEARAGAPSVSTIRTSDLGQLDWPVQGEIVYEYGPERQGSTTILREGVGIGAPPGTPVRAVESGTVAYAGPRNLYGQSVILSHGGGYYSVYLYMQGLNVVEGQAIEAGQVIGTVGGSASPEGPHLEFQIHEPSGGGAPRAVDPVRWLRGRS